MFCTKCGKKIDKASKFCTSCGVNLRGEIHQKIEDVHAGKNTSKINRINRRTYILSNIVIYLLILVGAFIIGLLYGTVTEYSEESLSILLFFLYIPMIVYAAKLNTLRLHDLGKSGWYQLWGLVPIANVVVSLYILLGGGQKEPNQYGEPPDDTFAFRQSIMW